MGPKIAQVYCLKRDSRPWHREEESRRSLQNFLSWRVLKGEDYAQTAPTAICAACPEHWSAPQGFHGVWISSGKWGNYWGKNHLNAPEGAILEDLTKPGKLPSVRLENKPIHGALGRGLGKDLPALWGIITPGLNTSLVLPGNLISKTQKD